jgi:hypothetical protein
MIDTPLGRHAAGEGDGFEQGLGILHPLEGEAVQPACLPKAKRLAALMRDVVAVSPPC